jgi:hypothetical protein
MSDYNPEMSIHIIGSALSLYRAGKISQSAFESEILDYVSGNGSVKNPFVRIEHETDPSKSFVVSVLPLQHDGVYDVYFDLGENILKNDWIIPGTPDGATLFVDILDAMIAAAPRATILMSYFDRQFENGEFAMSDILLTYLKVYLAALNELPDGVIDAIFSKNVIDLAALKKCVDDASDADEGQCSEIMERIANAKLLPDVFVTSLRERSADIAREKAEEMKKRFAKISGREETPVDGQLGNEIIASTDGKIDVVGGAEAGEKGGASLKF